MSDWKIIVPEAGTSLITNPSFEAGTASWNPDGTNTTTQSNVVAFSGNYSLLCTAKTGGSTNMGYYSITLPTTNTTYTVSAWAYVDTSWDGGAIYLNAESLSGATVTRIKDWTPGAHGTATWVQLETRITVASDVAGDIVIRSAGTASNNAFFNIDAFTLENKSYAPTYYDGDTDGCEWSGAYRASTSIRKATTWQAGRLRDFDDDYGFRVMQHVGTGETGTINAILPYAGIAGGLLQQSRRDIRYWRLNGRLFGATNKALRTTRATLAQILKPNRFGSESAPVVVRYTGQAPHRQIKGYYDSGMEGGNVASNYERVSLGFVSPEPFFTPPYSNSVSLSTSGSATLSYVAAKIDGAWNALGPPNTGGTAAYTSVDAIAVTSNDTVYVGGIFNFFDDIGTANNIVRWSGSAWESITTGGTANLGVLDLTIAPNGEDIYACGAFTQIGGTAVNRIAMYDASAGTWQGLGTGLDNNGRKMAFGPNGLLYVVGDFTTAGGGTVNGVGVWDPIGATWAGLTSGGTAGVTGGASTYGVAVASNNDVYVAGDFTAAGGTSAARVAYWDYSSSTWTAMNAGLTGGASPVGVDVEIDPIGRVFVGGTFTTAGGVTCSNVAYWNGDRFIPLEDGADEGVNNSVYALRYDASTGLLYLGGQFTQAGGLTTGDRIATWNGTSYAALDLDLPGTPIVNEITLFNGDLYLGFDTTGTGYYSNQTTVTNAGNEPAGCKFVLSRSGGTTAVLETIINETTGKKLLLNHTMRDGETVVLDMIPGRVQTFVLGTLGGDSTKATRWILQPGSDATDFSLVPGANSISVYINETGAPTINAFVQFHDTFGGVD